MSVIAHQTEKEWISVNKKSRQRMSQTQAEGTAEQHAARLEDAHLTGTGVVQSGRPIFDDFFQHLWPYIGNNTANVVFQMVKRLWLIRIDQ
ncbi:hypothetical protein TNCV_396641 [Trichonephila clavipes]|nr:hypothetical protein TNCV_396641 [Trichonephila clavipes]